MKLAPTAPPATDSVSVLNSWPMIPPRPPPPKPPNPPRRARRNDRRRTGRVEMTVTRRRRRGADIWRTVVRRATARLVERFLPYTPRRCAARMALPIFARIAGVMEGGRDGLRRTLRERRRTVMLLYRRRANGDRWSLVAMCFLTFRDLTDGFMRINCFIRFEVSSSGPSRQVSDDLKLSAMSTPAKQVRHCETSFVRVPPR